MILTKEFLASLTPTHWRGAGGEELVPIVEMDPAWLENAYAMCVAWGVEQRTEAMCEAGLADFDKPGWGPTELRSMRPGALEICRERIPPFRMMEWLVSVRTVRPRDMPRR